MLRNTSGQIASVQLIDLSGSEYTGGSVAVYYIGDDGTQALGGGTVKDKGHGTWYYLPLQAETNYAHVVYTFVPINGVSARAEYDTIVPSRIAAQVTTGPVAVVPAPPTNTQTTAWCYVYDEHGALDADVTISVAMLTTSGTVGAYSKVIATAVSNSSGVASVVIPRGTHLQYTVRRGNGDPVQFAGVNADTLQMPSVMG